MLELARNMTRRSVSEARRSVWELRSHLLEKSDLPSALAEAANLMAPRSGAVISVQTSGAPFKLPLHVESNFLRIAQEALTNALKHAQARHIDVFLSYEQDKVRLRVNDDGIGFERESTPAVYTSHFGLMDMSERTEKMGGSFSLVSTLGRGTEIIVEVAERQEPDAAEEALEVNNTSLHGN
jgi:signal transduction histidine kinase